MKKRMKKKTVNATMNALILASALGVLAGSGQAVAAEKTAWLVYKLNMQRLKDSGDGVLARKRIMSKIPKGTIISIPDTQASVMCDFNKSIHTYTDKIGRKTATCVYVGYVRDNID